MTRNILTFTILATLVLSSCTVKTNKENAESTTIEAVVDDIVTTSYVDEDGKVLDVLFNNKKGTATVTFE